MTPERLQGVNGFIPFNCLSRLVDCGGADKTDVRRAAWSVGVRPREFGELSEYAPSSSTVSPHDSNDSNIHAILMYQWARSLSCRSRADSSPFRFEMVRVLGSLCTRKLCM